MVQVFDPTPRPSQAGQLGQALGGALGDYTGQQLLAMRQRGALEDFKNMINPTDTPSDVTMKWAQSMAGIPGSEQMQQTILPQYLVKHSMNLIPGQEGEYVPPGQILSPKEGAPTSAPVVPGGMPSSPGTIPAGAQPASAPRGGVEDIVAPGGAPTTRPTPRGYNPKIAQFAMLTKSSYEDAARMFSGLTEAQIDAEIQNVELQKAKQLSDFAASKLPQMSQDDLNQFMRIGAKYQGMAPEDWFRATKRDHQKLQNVENSVKNANIPGIVSGLFRGPNYREQALKKLQTVMKPMVDLGEEMKARSILAEQDLSPAEIEMVVKPLKGTAVSNVYALPKAPYREEEFFRDMFADPDKPNYDFVKKENPKIIADMTNKYSDFLAKNVDSKVSLLGLREKLRREKDIDWRHFWDMLELAQSKGLVLSAEQEAELGSLQNAPLDSLPYIFQGWGRWVDYIKGKK